MASLNQKLRVDLQVSGPATRALAIQTAARIDPDLPVGELIELAEKVREYIAFGVQKPEPGECPLKKALCGEHGCDGECEQ